MQDYYSDNEEMLAKLAAGATGYDILVPTGNAVETLIAQGALRELDKAKITRLDNIKPEFLDQFFDPGNRYSVPYAYSVTLLGYNAEKMKELGLPTDTWAVIFEPKYLEKLKGKVTVLDRQRELFAAALMYLGYSANETDEAKLKRGARPDPAREALLGRVQRVVVHQGTDDRQHLARARLLERHVPGQRRMRRRRSVRSRIGSFDAQGRRGARGRQHGAAQERTAPGSRLPVHQLHAGRQELGGAVEHDRLRQRRTRRRCRTSTRAVRDNPAVFPDADEMKKLQMLKDYRARNAG